jgi:hypothetical protein
MASADLAMCHGQKEGGGFRFCTPQMRAPALDGPGHP